MHITSHECQTNIELASFPLRRKNVIKLIYIHQTFYHPHPIRSHPFLTGSTPLPQTHRPPYFSFHVSYRKYLPPPPLRYAYTNTPRKTLMTRRKFCFFVRGRSLLKNFTPIETTRLLNGIELLREYFTVEVCGRKAQIVRVPLSLYLTANLTGLLVSLVRVEFFLRGLSRPC